MAVKVGINGFGRIGRQVTKALFELYPSQFDLVAINDLTDSKTNAHLFKYDSNYGSFKGTVEYDETSLAINGDKIKVLAEKDPAKLPWKDLGVDIVVESTGYLHRRDQGQGAPRRGGAKKVIISAPAKDEDLTIVLGVNDDKYDPAKHHIISNASCTTNCLAPAAKVVHDNFGIMSGLDDHHPRLHQRPEDPGLAAQGSAPRPRRRAEHHPDHHRRGQGRRAGHPRPEGQVRRLALRVPTPTVSVVDFVADVEKATTTEETAQGVQGLRPQAR